MKYVLLLRGINVGGNSRVEMTRLKKLLEDSGYQNVITYINSGNVIFESEKKPDLVEVGRKLNDEFGFEIPALIIEGSDIIRIAEAIPTDWTNERDDQKSDVLYLFEKINNQGIIEKIGVKPEIETFIYVDGAVLANISRKNQSKGSLLKIMGSQLYKQMTIRNIKTAKKLAELIKA